MAAGAIWRQAAAVALLAVWAVAAHLASAGFGPVEVRVLVAVVPLLLAAGLALWRSPLPGPARWGLLLGVGVLLAGGWPALRTHLAWLFYLQHLGVHLALAAWFGGSLAAGHEPVVTAMARLIAPTPISPRVRRYTRGVTQAWTWFFLGNALVSTALFIWAPVAVWSVHANLLTGPLIALFFGAEMAIRRHVLPPSDRPSLADMLRAYRARRGAAAPAQPVPPAAVVRTGDPSTP